MELQTLHLRLHQQPHPSAVTLVSFGALSVNALLVWSCWYKCICYKRSRGKKRSSHKDYKQAQGQTEISPTPTRRSRVCAAETWVNSSQCQVSLANQQSSYFCCLTTKLNNSKALPAPPTRACLPPSLLWCLSPRSFSAPRVPASHWLFGSMCFYCKCILWIIKSETVICRHRLWMFPLQMKKTTGMNLWI